MQFGVLLKYSESINSVLKWFQKQTEIILSVNCTVLQA